MSRSFYNNHRILSILINLGISVLKVLLDFLRISAEWFVHLLQIGFSKQIHVFMFYKSFTFYWSIQALTNLILQLVTFDKCPSGLRRIFHPITCSPSIEPFHAVRRPIDDTICIRLGYRQVVLHI